MQYDPELNPIQRVSCLMNATLFFWISCPGKTTEDCRKDVKDVVTYKPTGENKAIELGDDKETEIIPPLPRNTWSPTRRVRLSLREYMRSNSV